MTERSRRHYPDRGFPLGANIYGETMWREWLGPWVLVAGRWFRLAEDSILPFIVVGRQRRWVFGPTTGGSKGHD